MSSQAAARTGDEIAHGFGMAAMIGGAILGVVAGAVLITATAATGGAAAAIVAGAVAGGGLSMGSLVKGLTAIFDLPEPSSGILIAGSPNVWVNSRPAQRASLDMAAVCSGFPINHSPRPMPLVAEGSDSVFINGCPAARLSSKLSCGAHIKSASQNVFWGGETKSTESIFDRESWLHTGLQGLGLLALLGGCIAGGAVGTIITLGGAVIGNTAFSQLREWGDSIGPGYADLFEGAAGVALLAGGGWAATKAKMPTKSETSGIVASSEGKTVTVYRVDSAGYAPRIAADGSVPFVMNRSGKERTLFVNFDQPGRAKEFAMVNREENATITAVEVDAAILDELRATAVYDKSGDAKLNPTAPLRVDINKAPDQFGLRTAEQIQSFRDAIIPGTARVIDPKTL